MAKKLVFLFCTTLLLFSCSGSCDKQVISHGKTLEAVRSRGELVTGINTQLPGFGYINSEGNNVGFDIDFSKAVATAIFGDKNKIEFRSVSSKERFAALQTGEIDILFRNTTWTFNRETDLGANFGPVIFYDGQGIMVRKDSNIHQLIDLNGATIGVLTGTTTEMNLADIMSTNGLSYKPIVFETDDSLFAAYDQKRLDAVTTDKSGLASRRSLLANPEEHYVLEETFSKEPLAPMIRQGDDSWKDLVEWVVFATMAAEEYGITSENVDKIRAESTNPRVRELLGVEGNMGEKLSLNNDWAYQVIKQVGNYAEIYDRNIGTKSVFNLPRGLNDQYTKGGLIYSPPFR